MKRLKRSAIWLFLLLLLGVAFGGAYPGRAARGDGPSGRGLLLVAHGSSDSGWNEQVHHLGELVRGKLAAGDGGGFSRVAVGFLEAEPSIRAGVARLEAQGVREIYALPLFMTPSEHLASDVPTVLGLYRERHQVERLRQEGIGLVHSQARITLGPPLAYGDLLQTVLLRQVSELSREASREGIVYLCHGSELYRPYWDRLLKEVAEPIAQRTGIGYWTYAYVGVGQSLIRTGLPAIEKAAAVRPRILVVSLYLGLSARELIERAVAKNEPIRTALQKRIDSGALVLGSKTLLPDANDLLTDWILQRAREYASIAASE